MNTHVFAMYDGCKMTQYSSQTHAFRNSIQRRPRCI